ncbi:hypothetical protein RHECIAT_CH0003342 [Rhizobium etli CIAT 652]|uniref:Uncharacterized protein n=1 Tax=Rhizobium etli (strain CIAT 652) TaxID=491916 RepID=B3PVS0_RHIE6|nr:hypothetical protein RHECIAT_CH0003342 [Rhizobium etli CIAT 652]
MLNVRGHRSLNRLRDQTIVSLRNGARTMDVRVIKHVREMRTASKNDFVEGLGRTLVEVAGGSLSDRKAKDGLSGVLRRAREGVPQIIGSTEDAAVIISVKDLATLLDAAKEQTFGEALDNVGFTPYRGARIVMGAGRHRETLKRRGGSVSPPTA